MAAADRFILEWSDVTGGYMRIGSWVVAGSSTATLLAAIQAASNANIQFATQGNPVVGVVTPTDALYGTVQDIASGLLASTIASPIRLTIPAPKAAIIGSDGVSINPSSPLYAAILAAASGVLCDQAGNTFFAFASGLRTSRRLDQNG